MNEYIPSVQSLSLSQDELPHVSPTDAQQRPIDHIALGDRVPFTLKSRQMAAFVATMSPEQQEAFEVQVAEQQIALRLQEKRKAKQMIDSSITATTRPGGVTLLDLPPENLTHVLLHLPFNSVVICQGVNRQLQALISESVELQYYIHLGIYGMLDNPHCDLPASERLNRLLVRERRWEDFNSGFYRVIGVPVVARYDRRDLLAGVFSILYQGGVLRQVQIPCEADQKVEWKEVHKVPFVINSGKRVLEHDLQILVTAQPRTLYTNAVKPHTVHEIQVHLSRFSTGEPHPDAQQTISFEMREEFEKPWAGVECVGDNLILVLNDGYRDHRPDDQVYAYNWKTGERKMKISAPFKSYMFPLCLTTHTFLLPNAKTGQLEYWRIPQGLSEATSHDRPFFILSLPPLSPGNVFHQIILRAQTQLTGGLQASSTPFYTDLHHAIIIFGAVVQPIDGSRRTVFTFFVHRSSFVEFLDRFSAFVSLDEPPAPVPYNDWGPSACRWFSEPSVPSLQFAGVFGQRYAAVASGTGPLTLFNFNPVNVAKVLATKKRHNSKGKALDEGSRDTGHDGGHQNIEKNQEERYTGKGKETLSQTSVLGTSSDPFTQGPQTNSSSSELQIRTKVIRGLDPLDDPHRCFENTVYSSLPYTEHLSQDEYRLEAVFLDEEHMLGIETTGGWDRITRLHVLHYG